jgi:N-acetylmuramoyl-L-alanine amidase
MRFRRLRASAALVFALAATRIAGTEPELVRTVVVSDELKVGISRGDLVFLFAKPLPGEGINAFVRRFTDDLQTKERVLRVNQLSDVLKAGSFLRVPYELLSGNYKRIAFEALFPDDRAEKGAWIHKVAGISGEPESLWTIAEWLTGDGGRYRDIRQFNKLASLLTERGQEIRVPVTLLLPAFRSAVAALETEEPSPLTFGHDEKGAFASYRLKKGEALYSAVVIRFTGLLHAADVNAEAQKIAGRSGISDVRSIPAGFEVRITPADLLPEYRPADDPERRQYERSLLESAQFVSRIRAENLRGVTVVLDPGHGGRDTGAVVGGVAEAAYCYDLALRIRATLEARSQAKVILTVSDADLRLPASRDVLDFTSGASVMTHPPYPIVDSSAGVHLRWYLANAIFAMAEKKNRDDPRVIFLSIHADSLHPSVRGAMLYIPGEKYLRESFSKSGDIYQARLEYRQAPRVRFSRRERLASEGTSRQLAESMVEELRRADLPVHPFHPIRENVVRSGREWVPAVLRYNRIPARVLLEVCNLNNDEDRALLQTSRYRDRVAAAVVASLAEFCGDSDPARRAVRKR